MQVAMRDVYAHTTVRRLARALDAARPAAAEGLAVRAAYRPSNLAYYSCGAAQTAFYALFGALAVAGGQAAFDWINEAVDSPLELYGRALLVATVWFFAHNGLAVAAKWLLVGRVARLRHSAMELRLLSFLGDEVHRPLGARQHLRRNAAVQRVSAFARRQDRS